MFPPSLSCRAGFPLFLTLQVVMGSGQNFFTQVGSGQVSHLWFWFWKFLQKNPKFFYFSPSGQKKSLLVGSKRSPCLWRVGILFTASQKYAQVGSRPISKGVTPHFVLHPYPGLKFTAVFLCHVWFTHLTGIESFS